MFFALNYGAYFFFVPLENTILEYDNNEVIYFFEKKEKSTRTPR